MFCLASDFQTQDFDCERGDGVTPELHFKSRCRSPAGLCIALERLGAEDELLSIVGSWRDRLRITLTRHATAET